MVLSKQQMNLIVNQINNRPMQKWLDDNDILMYSTHNEGKSIVAERFIKDLKGKSNIKIDS